MGDVVSTHLDDARKDMISAHTAAVLGEFGHLFEKQYSVALFNKVRFDIEGGGGAQPQLLQRKFPLENKSIFSGSVFQYLEENKKWRNRFLFIPDTYNIRLYDSKSAHDKGLQPKGTINCAGYKVLTSMEQYLDLIGTSLPGVTTKAGNSPYLKCATPYPLILWHPYARHYHLCVATDKEQEKWLAVLQDCVRHSNDGLSEDDDIKTPAFTDAVRFYRQAQDHYGTWEMMCGSPTQILSNLVMENLLPELREIICPRLRGKLHERQSNWMLISDAIYSLVQGQCGALYGALLQRCEASRPALEASIRTDMDQIITSKEHVTSKVKAVVLPKAEKLLKVSIQPYISSILDALMEPTSRGFSEVRDVFFRELVDMSKNNLNEGTRESVAQHMEKISTLAFHPVKMHSCYQTVEHMTLEGLQQRFDVSSPSVFVHRAQILMRKQMDSAVYTFEQILHQSLDSVGSEQISKTIQRCQDRVIKKFDYDSSSVRKRFFREALLQIFIPYMLKQLSPSCGSELPRFRELIFEDFSSFILVENIFEEVVLHSVMKDIVMAVKDAAVQRRHNLFRDSIVLSNSDPSLQLLGENPPINWAKEHEGGGGGEDEEAHVPAEDASGDGGESQKTRRMKQVVSMIQVEGPAPESCLDGIEEEEEEESKNNGGKEETSDGQTASASPKAPEESSDCSAIPATDKPSEQQPLKESPPEETPAPEATGDSPPPPQTETGLQRHEEVVVVDLPLAQEEVRQEKGTEEVAVGGLPLAKEEKSTEKVVVVDSPLAVEESGTKEAEEVGSPLAKEEKGIEMVDSPLAKEDKGIKEVVQVDLPLAKAEKGIEEVGSPLAEEVKSTEEVVEVDLPLAKAEKIIKEVGSPLAKEEKSTEEGVEVDSPVAEERKGTEEVMVVGLPLAKEEKGIEKVVEVDSPLAEEKSTEEVAEVDSPLAEEEKSTENVVVVDSPLADEEKSTEKVVEVDSPLAEEEKSTENVVVVDSPLAEEEKSTENVVVVDSPLADEEKSTEKVVEVDSPLPKEEKEQEKKSTDTTDHDSKEQ